MAQDPESRPISVSELLARSRQESGEDTSTAPESSSFAAQGRRRSGRDGSMSVAELTGEIPKVTGAEPSPAAATSTDGTTGGAPRSSNPSVTRSESAFPRSSSPAPSSSGSGRTASGMPGMVSRAEPALVSREPADVADAQTETTLPTVDAPATADFNSTAITGIIPVVEDAPDDDDLDFEAYRNFADYETDEPGAGTAKKDKPRKERRGLFGRKKADRSRASVGKGLDAAPVPNEITAPEPVVDDAPSDPPPAIAPSVVATDPTPAIVPSVRRSAIPASPQADDADTGPAITPHVVARTPDVAPHRPESSIEDTAEISVVTSEPMVRPAVTPSAPVEPAVPEHVVEHDNDDFQVIDDAPAAPEPSHGVRTTLRKAIVDDTEAGDVPDEAPLAAKHSPVMQWLLLIGQTIVGLAVGAALFWGFTELWKWNVIFALVLAAVVIFGIVTLVHVVRRRHDLISTLLALGVGLIVTIGPLVLLASSSS
ncbi:hypothetical protein HH308_21965 [Gordonia sp. TBRC 11910]|uniref:Transmembrane protein n=1 Tax=Gordonia asplenii TaxID=2725283 RepID=A0A848KYS3_9ACTN|nr:hypothetical protein [Gordonia asplenii]NMO03884.1 hypothetical protein [Gordonia asplenii]